MNDPARPPAEEQLSFLLDLKRLLNKGRFHASYKLALLHAIADLCVREDDNSGDELELSTSEIADEFIWLYWPQVAPYPAGDDKMILRQNRGPHQAKIVGRLAEQYYLHQGSLATFRGNSAAWSSVRHMVERRVRKMPLWRLQKIGPERLEFLYENVDDSETIRLQPGVASCFRACYPTIADMIEEAWTHFVDGLNREVLDEGIDLRSFLFRSWPAHRPEPGTDVTTARVR